MTERIRIHPNDARRLAAARAKAHIEKEQKLPGYKHRSRNGRNKKK